MKIQPYELFVTIKHKNPLPITGLYERKWWENNPKIILPLYEKMCNRPNVIYAAVYENGEIIKEHKK